MKFSQISKKLPTYIYICGGLHTYIYVYVVVNILVMAASANMYAYLCMCMGRCKSYHHYNVGGIHGTSI